MFKFIAKQFFYGRAYLWIKEKLAGILLAAVLLILVFYIHSEYLNYIEYKSANDTNYIGTSFIVKNFLILAIVFGYFYFFRKINQTKKSIQDTKETIIRESKDNDKAKVKSLDEFLEDEEIDR